MAKEIVRVLRSETDYDAALEEIERYFESEPEPALRTPIVSIFSH